MPRYKLEERMVNGQPMMAKIYKPSRRKAASRITGARFQVPGKAAKFLAVDNGQINYGDM